MCPKGNEWPQHKTCPVPPIEKGPRGAAPSEQRALERTVLTAMRQIGILAVIVTRCDEPDGGGKKWRNEIGRM